MTMPKCNGLTQIIIYISRRGASLKLENTVWHVKDSKIYYHYQSIQLHSLNIEN